MQQKQGPISEDRSGKLMNSMHQMLFLRVLIREEPSDLEAETTRRRRAQRTLNGAHS